LLSGLALKRGRLFVGTGLVGACWRIGAELGSSELLVPSKALSVALGKLSFGGTAAGGRSSTVPR